MSDIERVTFTINKNKVDEVEIYNFLQSQKEKGIPFSQTIKKALLGGINETKYPPTNIPQSTTNKSKEVKEPKHEKPLLKGFQAPNSDNFL